MSRLTIGAAHENEELLFPMQVKAEPAQRCVLKLSVEGLGLIVSAFLALTANRAFLTAVEQDLGPDSPAFWWMGGVMLVVLLALNFGLLMLVSTRHMVKPVAALLLVISALASYYIDTLSVYIDTTMLRNVMRTDVAETRELISLSLLLHLLLFAALPVALLTRVRIQPRTWVRAAAVRAGSLVAAVLTLGVGVVLTYQPLSSLVRNHKEVRYLITPANVLWSASRVVVAETRGAARPRVSIGDDAQAGAGWAQRERPLLVVLVVGETARAANWGLSGYARQTTPLLAQLAQSPQQAQQAQQAQGPLINFSKVIACGTNTETSLPCMFAPVGRRDYDEDRIRGSQSLLHVLHKAGVGVLWRDNQSGCKGVCEGLPQDTAQQAAGLAECPGGRCLDELLLADLDTRIAQARGVQLLVMHQLGNHGPSYFRRYPPRFAQFTPACGEDDLQRCAKAHIVNAYDNALLYTDELLATLIKRLAAQSSRVDSAVVYVSDHGESLGESNLFLHGLPFRIAPDVQKEVPMVWWLSDGYVKSRGLDTACLRSRAAQPASHDHLFHSMLTLLDVKTALYEPAWDIAGPCLLPKPGVFAAPAR